MTNDNNCAVGGSDLGSVDFVFHGSAPQRHRNSARGWHDDHPPRCWPCAYCLGTERGKFDFQVVVGLKGERKTHNSVARSPRAEIHVCRLATVWVTVNSTEGVCVCVQSSHTFDDETIGVWYRQDNERGEKYACVTLLNYLVRGDLLINLLFWNEKNLKFLLKLVNTFYVF